MIGSQAFVSRATLALAGLEDPTHLFVEVTPGTDGQALREALAAIPDVQVLSPADFVERNLRLPRQVSRPILGAIVALVTVVATLIVVTVLRADSLSRREEYALLGAVGLPSRQIFRSVVVSVVLTAGTGAVVGATSAVGVVALGAAVIPRLTTAVSWWVVAGVASGALLLAFVAALGPARAVTRTDPALVFRV